MADVVLGRGAIVGSVNYLSYNGFSASMCPKIVPIEVGQAHPFARLHDDMPVLLTTNGSPPPTFATFTAEPEGNVEPVIRADPLTDSVEPFLQERLHLGQNEQMPLSWWLVRLRLAPSVVQGALGAMARLAIVVRLLGWCRVFRLAAFKPTGLNRATIFNAAVRVTDIADRHAQLLMRPEPPHGVAAEKQAISERIRPGHGIRDHGDFLQPESGASRRLSLRWLQGRSLYRSRGLCVRRISRNVLGFPRHGTLLGFLFGEQHNCLVNRGSVLAQFVRQQRLHAVSPRA
jgi:hypothetical protein